MGPSYASRCRTSVNPSGSSALFSSPRSSIRTSRGSRLEVVASHVLLYARLQCRALLWVQANVSVLVGLGHRSIVRVEIDLADVVAESLSSGLAVIIVNLRET